MPVDAVAGASEDVSIPSAMEALAGGGGIRLAASVGETARVPVGATAPAETKDHTSTGAVAPGPGNELGGGDASTASAGAAAGREYNVRREWRRRRTEEEEDEEVGQT